MVYISNPTEDGTLYTKEELTDLSATCYDCGLCLFVDGARMAYGLASEANDLNLQDYANLCDVFYLGGTKCGALFGEAVIINNPDLDQDFRYAIKQHGAMLAKGRLLGLQFLALLNGEDGTGSSPYYTMAAKADRQAMRIRAAFEAKGCAMLFDSPTNQQFPILPNSWYNALSEKYAMTLTAKPDAEHTAVRFCTSWATRNEDVDALLAQRAHVFFVTNWKGRRRRRNVCKAGCPALLVVWPSPAAAAIAAGVWHGEGRSECFKTSFTFLFLSFEYTVIIRADYGNLVKEF